MAYWLSDADLKSILRVTASEGCDKRPKAEPDDKRPTGQSSPAKGNHKPSRAYKRWAERATKANAKAKSENDKLREKLKDEGKQ